mgnify:CR=1 FL=1
MVAKGVVEASIKLRRPDCPLLLLLFMKPFNVRFYNIAVSGEGVRHIVSLDSDNLESFLEATRGLLRVRVIDRREGLLWVENPLPCSFCRTLDSLKGLPLGLNLEGRTPIYRVILPSRIALTRMLSRLKAQGLEPELLYETRRLRVARLTESQIRALILAYEYGFFDFPKKVNLVKLSRILGVKPSTLDEILRRALRKLVEDYLLRQKG